jgi:uncharacterized protein YecE (DUF72 family)
MRKRSNIYIGTSGWSYKHWKEIYYPSKLKARDQLAFFAEEFDCVEINSSFYRIPTKETLAKWLQQVPQRFVFCPKLSRYLSHLKKLRDPEEPLDRFFTVFDTMNGRLGPLLIQLPANATFNAAVAENFYALLSGKYRDYKFSMEVRHESWYSAESLDLMRKYRVGIVITNSGGLFPTNEVVTANHIYLRFHGPGALYASSYHHSTLLSFAKKCLEWEKRGHTVWVFFNNDINGYALDNAVKMKSYVEIHR